MGNESLIHLGEGTRRECTLVVNEASWYDRLLKDLKWSSSCTLKGYSEAPHVRHLVGYTKVGVSSRATWCNSLLADSLGGVATSPNPGVGDEPVFDRLIPIAPANGSRLRARVSGRRVGSKPARGTETVRRLRERSQVSRGTLSTTSKEGRVLSLRIKGQR